MSESQPNNYQPRVPLKGKRVLVAMSGGVDSSVAAALLVGAGAEVLGATYKNFCFTESDALPGRSCCSVDAVADALAVCRRLGIEHGLVDETERFGSEVIDNFHAEYRAGHTPNPCVRCNAQVRFPRLIEEADARGCDYVATGHYARIVEVGGRHYLAAGTDGDKDQSYFLAATDPACYPRVLFPLGGFEKAVTRILAREAGIHVHEKRESQDVCFLAGRSLRQYLGEEGALRPGPILDGEGRELGRHDGVELLTIGQRHGLGVAGGHPLYVTEIDAASASVTLGDSRDLLRREITCSSTWLHSEAEKLPLAGKIRYRSPARPVEALKQENGELILRFAEPISAPAPGQSLVLYHEHRVMGEGTIRASRP
jgi:tRNA-specific 2-thiouridylase